MDYYPADIIRLIAQQNPRTYGQLASLNRRYRQVVEPVISTICQSPIGGSEIANNFQNSTLISPDGKVRIGNEDIYFIEDMVGVIFDLLLQNGFTVVDQAPLLSPGQRLARRLLGDNKFVLVREEGRPIVIEIFPNEYAIRLKVNPKDVSVLVDILLKEGFILLGGNVRQSIYDQRRSCVQRDPNYSLKMTIRDFRQQLAGVGSRSRDNETVELYYESIVDDLADFLQIHDDYDHRQSIEERTRLLLGVATQLLNDLETDPSPSS